MDIKLIKNLQKLHEDVFEPVTAEEVAVRKQEKAAIRAEEDARREREHAALPFIPFERLIPPGNTQIWYAKPGHLRNLVMGYDYLKQNDRLPDPTNLEATHKLLGTINQTDLNTIYAMMQGEVWSPRGEARRLIRDKGLSHTSMSVGDIIVRDGDVIMVDSIGFASLSKQERVRIR
jgi:hypothetical protein